MPETHSSAKPYNVLAVIQGGRLEFEAALFAVSFHEANPDFAGRLIFAEPQPGPLWKEDPRIVHDDVRALIAEHEAIDDTFSFVKFTQLADFALVLRVYCFSKSTAWTDYLELQEELLLRIMEIVAKNGAEMAFPTQTLYLRDEQWPARSGAGANA